MATSKRQQQSSAGMTTRMLAPENQPEKRSRRHVERVEQGNNSPAVRLMISLGLVLLMVIGAYLLALQPFSRRTAEPPVTAPPVTTPIEGIVCKPVSGLPVFRKATCLKHEEAQDDGLIQTENTYLIAAPAGDVRRFYEEAITRNDWTVQEASFDAEDSSWEYTVIQGTRRLKIEVEASQTPDNAFTKFKIAEK